jgi:hypothetical protein
VDSPLSSTPFSSTPWRPSWCEGYLGTNEQKREEEGIILGGYTTTAVWTPHC